jgi:hypothetical protein
MTFYLESENKNTCVRGWKEADIVGSQIVSLRELAGINIKSLILELTITYTNANFQK